MGGKQNFPPDGLRWYLALILTSREKKPEKFLFYIIFSSNLKKITNLGAEIALFISTPRERNSLKIPQKPHIFLHQNLDLFDRILQI